MPSVRFIYHLPENRPDARRDLIDAGRRWLSLARADVAKKTGKLRGSLYYEVSRLVSRWKLEVGTKGVPYAAYQEAIQPYAEQNFEEVTRGLGGTQVPITQRRLALELRSLQRRGLLNQQGPPSVRDAIRERLTEI